MTCSVGFCFVMTVVHLARHETGQRSRDLLGQHGADESSTACVNKVTSAGIWILCRAHRRVVRGRGIWGSFPIWLVHLGP
ncbi:hypothetical protein F5Y10DRAFT_54007 [Nemania abortiva]|nr:hypothetical protein F5Y10DRAFT_54007 [Nemania abortiva]